MAARAGGNDRGDFVLFDQDESVVSLHLKHVVFVGDDHAVELLAVLEADFIGMRARNGKCGDTDRYTPKNQPTGSHICEYGAEPRRGQPPARKELSAASRSMLLRPEHCQEPIGGGQRSQKSVLSKNGGFGTEP